MSLSLEEKINMLPSLRATVEAHGLLAKKALGWVEAWEIDMNTLHKDITATVAKYLEDMDKNGMKAAVERFVNG